MGKILSVYIRISMSACPVITLITELALFGHADVLHRVVDEGGTWFSFERKKNLLTWFLVNICRYRIHHFQFEGMQIV